MPQFLKSACLSLALLGLLSASALAQDVSGTWLFELESPEGSMQLQIVFQQDGTAVTGEAEFDMVEDTEISDGVFEDGVLSFMLHVGVGAEWISAEVEAEVDGDEMTGASYSEFGTMPFTAKRSEGDS
jgi:hypothetical protein